MKKIIISFFILGTIGIFITMFYGINFKQNKTGEINKNNISDTKIKDKNIVIKKINKNLDIPGGMEILKFIYLPESDTIWGLTMNFDPTIKNYKSNYSIIEIKKDRTIIEYKTDIPVGNINTPYRAKAQINFFKLIDNKYLNIGIQHLDGIMYILKFNIRNPNAKHFTMTLKMDSESDSSNMLLSNDGSIFFAGSKKGKVSIVSIDKNKKTLYKKKDIISFHNRKLKVSKLLNNNNLLLAFNSYTGPSKLTSMLVLIDNKGNIIEKKVNKGLAISIFSTINNSILITFAHDQEGKNMEANIFNTKLISKSKFKIPNYFKLMDAAGKLIATDNSLISMLVDRTPGSDKLVEIKEYSKSGNKTIGIIKNNKPGKLRAYNISSMLFGKEIYIGVATIGIGKENLGIKTYNITTLEENKIK